MLGLLSSDGGARKYRKNARIEDYEGRQISAIELVFEGTANEPAAQADFIALLKVAPNTQFSAVHVRESLQVAVRFGTRCQCARGSDRRRHESNWSSQAAFRRAAAGSDWRRPDRLRPSYRFADLD